MEVYAQGIPPSACMISGFPLRGVLSPLPMDGGQTFSYIRIYIYVYVFVCLYKHIYISMYVYIGHTVHVHVTYAVPYVGTVIATSY